MSASGWQERPAEQQASSGMGAIRMLRGRMLGGRWREKGDVIPIEKVSKSLVPVDTRLDEERAKIFIQGGFAEACALPKTSTGGRHS